MSHVLKLINKGSRVVPTTYKFGANEHLNIHAADNYADLTDAATGSYIRYIGWDGLRNMNYAPAKLLAGNEADQLLDSPIKSCPLKQTTASIKYILSGFAMALILAAVGNVTGCNDYVINQVEQDIATSTIYKAIPSSLMDAEQLVDVNATSVSLMEINLLAGGVQWAIQNWIEWASI